MTRNIGMVTMKILALNGSARKKGNTDILIDQILKGSRKGKHATEKLYLYDYEILPCMDCREFQDLWQKRIITIFRSIIGT